MSMERDITREKVVKVLRHLSAPPSLSVGWGTFELADTDSYVEDQDESLSYISRNYYGALVFNTPDIFIADIDISETAFSGSSKSVHCLQTKDNYLAWFKRRVNYFSDQEFYIYETHSGFRVIMVSSLMNPVSEESSYLMEALFSDKLYASCCVSQKCYRARLTPKPSRIGLPKEADQTQEWLDKYQKASEDYSVCIFRGSAGSCKPIHPKVAKFLEIHDQYTLGGRALA